MPSGLALDLPKIHPQYSYRAKPTPAFSVPGAQMCAFVLSINSIYHLC